MGKTSMRNGARRGKAVRSSKAFTATVADAVRYARSLRGKGLTWIEVSNALFGPGGKLTQLCPTEAERVALAKAPEYQEIMRVIEEARDDEGDPSGAVGNWMSTASGTTTLRIPKSLHAALIAEAEAEGISLNQLCLTKLAVQLRAAVMSH